MGRSIAAGVLARDQLDIYNPPSSFTRETGVVPGDLTLVLFVNNVPVVWTILDGTTVADSSISAGSVYFHEIPTEDGFYNVRFFPDRVGYWRMVFGVNSIEIIKEYDVVSSTTGNTSGGLNASFIK